MRRPTIEAPVVRKLRDAFPDRDRPAAAAPSSGCTSQRHAANGKRPTAAGTAAAAPRPPSQHLVRALPAVRSPSAPKSAVGPAGTRRAGCHRPRRSTPAAAPAVAGASGRLGRPPSPRPSGRRRRLRYRRTYGIGRSCVHRPRTDAPAAGATSRSARRHADRPAAAVAGAASGPRRPAVYPALPVRRGWATTRSAQRRRAMPRRVRVACPVRHGRRSPSPGARPGSAPGAGGPRPAPGGAVPVVPAALRVPAPPVVARRPPVPPGTRPGAGGGGYRGGPGGAPAGGGGYRGGPGGAPTGARPAAAAVVPVAWRWWSRWCRPVPSGVRADRRARAASPRSSVARNSTTCRRRRSVA